MEKKSNGSSSNNNSNNNDKRGREGEEAKDSPKKQRLSTQNHQHEAYESSSSSDDNCLALGVFDFPWLKESMISKSSSSEEEEWFLEDSLFSFSRYNAHEFSGQCLSERPETCLDIIPLGKFEESIWSLEMDQQYHLGVDCSMLNQPSLTQ